MKLSEVMTGQQWSQCLAAAGGNVEKAKVFAAIGWHETHFGRTPGYGQDGYILGVGAYGGGHKQYRGLDAQLDWTAERLGSQPSYSLADLQWYGREVQKPTTDTTNTGTAWGSSVYSIYKDLVVDLAPEEGESPAGSSDVATAYERSPEWAQYAVMALLLFVGTLILPKGGRPSGQA